MYVDKPLSDVKAVQTLSRLNRAYPSKTDTFILDFVNTVDGIKSAFAPFYKTTILSEETDLDRLNNLQDALDGYQVYSPEDVNQFMARFLEEVDREQLDPILNACVETYKQDLDEDEKIDFKVKAKSFVRNYQFLVQIRTFRNTYWESLKTFLKFLILKLPLFNEADFTHGVLESISVDSYRVEQQTTQAILLEEDAELSPTPPEPRGRRYEPDLDFLSNIIQEFNQRFGSIFKADKERVRRFLLEELPREVSQDEEYQNAKNSSDRQNARITFEKKLENAFQDFIFDHTEAYRQYTDNSEFKSWLDDTLFEMDYDRGVTQLQLEQPTRRPDDARNQSIVWRGSTAGDLLKYVGTWVGDDLDECLQAVYDNRTEAEF